jgi:beta-N-acetylhexosaminidase
MDKQIAANVVLGSLSGTKLTPDELKLLSEYEVPGVTLFSRNTCALDDRGLRDYLSVLQRQRKSSLPYLVCVDQEGGRVSRLKNLSCPDLGPSLFLENGSTNNTSLENIKKYGSSLGVSLAEFGINVNFAPVVDILSREDNDSIGDRCFGSDVDSVVLRSSAFLSGLQQAGVLGCLKHFPGQGHADFDTHFASAKVSLQESELRSRELIPFLKLKNLAPMVMLSHCYYPDLCAYEASRSATIITGLLRNELGYKGLVVSDDLTMAAVGSCEQDWREYLIDSIAAGTDLILVCKESSLWLKAIEILDNQRKKSLFFARRLEQAAMRVRYLRKNINNSRSLLK